jgi:hypothetical protein
MIGLTAILKEAWNTEEEYSHPIVQSLLYK